MIEDDQRMMWSILDGQSKDMQSLQARSIIHGQTLTAEDEASGYRPAFNGDTVEEVELQYPSGCPPER